VKQPLVECDILVEVATDRLTAQRGDFLIVYFTDPERRRAIAVKTLQPRANGQPLMAMTRGPVEGVEVPSLSSRPRNRRHRLAQPALAKRKQQGSKRENTDIEWYRALGQPRRQVAIGDHIRQTVFDLKGDFISQQNLVTKCGSTVSNVHFAMRAPVDTGWVVRTRENGRRGYRLTPDGAAYLENFRRRPAAVASHS